MTYEADAPNVLVTVLSAESQSLGELLAHDVAVEQLDSGARLLQLVKDQLRNGSLAGTWQAREPERHPAVFIIIRVVGFHITVPPSRDNRTYERLTPKAKNFKLPLPTEVRLTRNPMIAPKSTA